MEFKSSLALSLAIIEVTINFTSYTPYSFDLAPLWNNKNEVHRPQNPKGMIYFIVR